MSEKIKSRHKLKRIVYLIEWQHVDTVTEQHPSI